MNIVVILKLLNTFLKIPILFTQNTNIKKQNKKNNKKQQQHTP